MFEDDEDQHDDDENDTENAPKKHIIIKAIKVESFCDKKFWRTNFKQDLESFRYMKY